MITRQSPDPGSGSWRHTRDDEHGFHPAPAIGCAAAQVDRDVTSGVGEQPPQPLEQRWTNDNNYGGFFYLWRA